MEHPLIGNLDHLNMEELSAKINELNKKLGIATRSGNGYMCDQIRMALESYQTKYREKLEANYKRDQGDANFDDKIDIR